MLHEKSVSEMKGALSAIFTPFDSSNEINFDALSSIAEYQLSHGLKGFYATGTTGEGLLLSSEERTSVVRHLVDHFGDRATIVAHVGHPSTDVSVSLAKSSAEAGAKLDFLGGSHLLRNNLRGSGASLFSHFQCYGTPLHGLLFGGRD